MNPTQGMPEIWKPIADAPGYMASNLGRIKSQDRVITRSNGVKLTCRGRTLKPVMNPHGYHQVSLSRGRRSVPVHQLVCAAFNGPRPVGATLVRHLDGDKLNNCSTNLAWGDQHLNMLDMAIHERTNTTKLTANEVREIRALIAEGNSLTGLAERFGVSRSNIALIKEGKTWRHVV